jgi:hypothetical protein
MNQNKDLFLKLTEKTIPYGKESLMEKYLPEGIQKDEFGNYFLKIGESKTMFTCHLDSATGRFMKVKHVINSEIFIETNGKSVLSADDKSGMLIMLRMIEKKIPGLYYFFLGEESGCQGSSWLKRNKKELLKQYNKCVSFDRRGYGSVISRQMGRKCTSSEFAEELSKQYNEHFDFAKFNDKYVELGLELDEFTFKPDPTGIYTDSAQFIGIIPECTNISVGYFNEHSGHEYQNILYLDLLVDATMKIDWENLPFGEVKEEKPYSYYDDEDEFHF